MLKKSFTVKFDNIAYIFINDSFEFITPWELHMRTKIKTFYRFILAVFFSAHIFDFLFNPIWMHGYIWALNQLFDMDMSDKSAGYIINYQLSIVSYNERIICACLSTIAVYFVLRIAGYSEKNHISCEVVKLSLVCGAVNGLSRSTELNYRLYAILHECFYVYFHFFTISFCLLFKHSYSLSNEN